MAEQKQKVLPDGEKEEQELEEAEEEFKEEQKNTETVPGSADPRFEEAEEVFKEELGSDMANVTEPKKEQTAEQNQQILKALGFKRYEDPGVVKYNIHVMDIKIGVTFNETNPFGMVWAYKIPEGDEQKEFLKNGELKDHPLIKKYEAIKEGKEPSKEETAQRYQDILIALGFTRYDNKEKGIACKLKVGHLLLGRTFTEQHPIGNMWVSCTADCEYGKKGEFLNKDQCKQIPQVNLFYRIRNGEMAIPEPTVTGKVIGKSAKAVQIQFNEFDETDTQWWGLGALKKDKEGIDYVPSSYSKETVKYTAKMQVPRDIILLNYDEELKAAPLVTQTETAEKKEESREKAEPQPTEKGTLADAIDQKKEPEATAPEPIVPKTVPELIAKYLDILAQTTIAVKQDDRIADREKGYATKFVYDDVIAELRNGKESNHENR